MKPYFEHENLKLLHGVVDPLVIGNDHRVPPHCAVVLKIFICFGLLVFLLLLNNKEMVTLYSFRILF